MVTHHKQRQRVILVTELFYPEEISTAHILTKIAGKLVEDFDVLVLTGPESYESGTSRHAPKTPVNIGEIERVRVPDLSKNNLLGRLFRLAVLSIALGWRTLLRSRRKDIVFAVTNPAPLLAVLAIVRMLRRFRLVFLTHDVFPENAVAAGIIRKESIFYPLVKHVFAWAYGSADAIITIGRDMSEVLARKIPHTAYKIKLIENWADSPLVEPVPRDRSMIVSMGLSEKVVVQYAGNIGRAQGVLEFVDLISAVENDDIRYVFRGSGALSVALSEATKGRRKFIVEGSYPRSDQGKILSSCDIALVILGSQMFGLGVPSKTYNIMAAGKPILFIGPKNSEIYRLVRENNIGWAFDWCEGAKLLSLISSFSTAQIDLYAEIGCRARLLANERYSEAAQLEKFSDLLKEI
jgi:glycosyltransferase involved in cell wall biosynthesis